MTAMVAMLFLRTDLREIRDVSLMQPAHAGHGSDQTATPSLLANAE
ncbi:MAG: hypothetical protein ABI277_04065 [Burkholderiaceae bacterium]